MSVSTPPAFFAPIHHFLSRFPLHTYPPLPLPSAVPPSGLPTLWILPPTSPATAPLSRDVECLKWQAWLALKGLAVGLRTDVPPEGGLNGRLPTLQLPDNTLVSPSDIPSALDGRPEVEHQGYISAQAELDGKAFISLLEETVHPALFPSENPFKGPITGILPPSWLAIEKDSAYRYNEVKEAISALSGTLGNDLWFLGSRGPTALDAAAYAYLHIALNVKPGQPAEVIKKEVQRWPNLVRWESGVGKIVREAFQ